MTDRDKADAGARTPAGGPSDLLEILDRLPPRFGTTGQRRLAALGVDFFKLNACGTPRPARVRPEGGLFAFDDTGPGMLIQPVTDGPQASIFTGVADPAVVDLLAYQPDAPARWYLFRGESALALGQDAIRDAAVTGDPLRLFRTPLTWLAGGGDGACLLDWRRWRSLLAGVDRLVGEDDAHDREITRLLRADRSDLPDVGPIDAPPNDASDPDDDDTQTSAFNVAA